MYVCFFLDAGNTSAMVAWSIIIILAVMLAIAYYIWKRFGRNHSADNIDLVMDEVITPPHGYQNTNPFQLDFQVQPSALGFEDIELNDLSNDSCVDLEAPMSTYF